MKQSLLALVFVFAFPLGSTAIAGETPATNRPSPLNGFVQNRGQWDSEVLYYADQGGMKVAIFQDALAFIAESSGRNDPESTFPAAQPLTLRFPRTVGPIVVEARDPISTEHHFFLGSRRVSHVPGFERVVYKNVGTGVDLQVRIENGRFSYDLLVAPCGNLESFFLEIEGAESATAIQENVLQLHTLAGTMEHRINGSWQTRPDGEREILFARFCPQESVGRSHRIGFEVPLRNPNLPLVIDPSLAWAGYTGGPNYNRSPRHVVDQVGNIFLLQGYTGAPPVATHGSFQPVADSVSYDLWIGKLSPDGTQLIWAGFLGGSDYENADAQGLAVDKDGTIVVAGATWSSDFPTTPGCLQSTYTVSPFVEPDLFITRISADGSSLVWSTYFGSTATEMPTEYTNCVALTPLGDVVVSAQIWSVHTQTPSLATPGVIDSTYNFYPFQFSDNALLRISADGSQLVFFTYFGASVHTLLVDGESNIYAAGTVTPNIPTALQATPGAFKTVNQKDAFIAKINPTATEVLWATYFGGDDSSESILGLALDSASAIYIAGSTSSDDFPTTNGSFDTAISGSSDGFAAKLFPEATGLVWSTYIGACCGGTSSVADLAVDAAGNMIISGHTNEPNWPTTSDAFQPFYVGPFPYGDAALTKFDVFGDSLVYSTYFSGSGSDDRPLVEIDGTGDPVIVFSSSSSDLATTSGALYATNPGTVSVAVAKFDLELAPWQVLSGGVKGTKHVPNLAGCCSNAMGAQARLSLRGAAPTAPAIFVAGLSELNLPVFGGSFVPSPDLILPLTTNGDGSLDLTANWPTLPPGLILTFQFWVQDFGASNGWSASNAVRALTP